MRIFQLKASPVRTSQHHFFNRPFSEMKTFPAPRSASEASRKYCKSILEMNPDELSRAIGTKRKEK